ncbi:hypothetical protein ACWF62_20475, partial [Rhodococcus sp. NPDC054953]
AGRSPRRPVTREDLDAEHGPLRPVGPSDPADVATLCRALGDAGALAAGSVLVALYRLVAEYNRSSSPSGSEAAL